MTDLGKLFGSLRTRIFLFVIVLLLVILGAFSFAAFGEVRDSLTQVAEARLASAADQLARLLDQSVTGQISALEELLEQNEVQRYLEDPRPATEAGVTALLDSAVASSEARLGLTLRMDGGTVLTAGDGAGPADDAPTPGVSPFVQVDGRVEYSTTVPVAVSTEGTAERRGFLVDRRTVTGDSGTGQLVRDLIGTEALFFIGHRRGGLWTDLSGQVPDFSTPIGATTGTLMPDTVSGTEVLGMIGDSGEFPWVAWVGLPRSAVMAPLRSFIARMGVAAALLALLGALGAWALGRRITRPLASLTDAAEAIEGGDYSRRIPSPRRDEIGRLARSFDAMARKVEASRDRLEQRVAHRTAELETALADLEAAQEELVRKERLAILGELAGGVGHELRNPLGVMTNAVYYLETVQKDRPPVVGEYLEILRNQIHISEKIVGDLLDFARTKPPERRDVSVAALVEEQLDRAPVPADAVDVRLDFPDDLPPVHVDADQVAQIALNLITNAFQAMEDDGGTLTLRGRISDEGVRLEVADEGPGIPPAQFESVFEPLFTTKPKGIGLGLSVSRSLAEANEGSLSVKNAGGGRGAVFVLDLPASSPEEAEE